ncbi:MAG: hypothetical protein J2P37_02520 [Ktedonobacteraceae bacterium]|nr:hypothetical protein [Ktedonobacteraceae bacterium]
MSRRPTTLARLALRAQAVCEESDAPTLHVIWRQGITREGLPYISARQLCDGGRLAR